MRVQKTFDYVPELRLREALLRKDGRGGAGRAGVEKGNISFKGRVCALTLQMQTNSVLGAMDRRHRMSLNRVVVWT